MYKGNTILLTVHVIVGVAGAGLRHAVKHFLVPEKGVVFNIETYLSRITESNLSESTPEYVFET
jgi:hypothetical protein